MNVRVCLPFFHRWVFLEVISYAKQRFECSKCKKLKDVYI